MAYLSDLNGGRHELLNEPAVRRSVGCAGRKAIIVIGRSKEWDPAKKRALHGLNQRLHCISIMTYDHLLAQGERMLQMLSAPSESSPPQGIDRRKINPSQIDHASPVKLID